MEASNKLIHYPFFTKLMEANGFKFESYERPYDKYSDGKEWIGICEKCRIVALGCDRKQGDVLKILVDYLYNKPKSETHIVEFKMPNDTTDDLANLFKD